MHLLAEAGRNIGDDAALLQGDGAAVEAAHQFMLVGDDKHRDAHLADTFQQFHHLKAHLGYGLADSRYRHGAATYLEVLDAQRSMVSARQALISTQLSRAASRVTFFKVLGGGAELPATEETTKQANG